MKLVEKVIKMVADNKELCAALAFAGGILAFGGGFIKHMSEPIEETGVVCALDWERTVSIGRKKLVKDSAWEAPKNAKIYDTQYMFKKMIKVPSGVDAHGVTQYREEPQYATKYYYEIEKWVTDRTLRSHGSNCEPFDPEFTLSDGEKVLRTNKNYSITVRLNTGEIKTFKIDECLWEALHQGQKVTITTNRLNPNTIMKITTPFESSWR